jgi:transposase-like protein
MRFCPIGIDLDGMRDIIGISVSRSEAEVHWRGFLQTLTKRGLHDVESIVAEDHAFTFTAPTTSFYL